MKELYRPEDLIALRSQLKRRIILLLVGCGLLLAVAIWSLSARIEWLTMGAFILLGAAAIFVIELLCRPISQYKRLIDSALHGRSHTETLEFARVEPDSSLVDGVPCRSLVFLGEPDKHGERERMYYWDERLPLPVLKEGEAISIRYTGKNIIGIACCSE